MGDYEATKNKIFEFIKKGVPKEEFTELVDVMLDEAYENLDKTRNIPPSKRGTANTKEYSKKAIDIGVDILKCLGLQYQRIEIYKITLLNADTLKLWHEAKRIIDDIEETCINAGYIDVMRRMKKY